MIYNYYMKNILTAVFSLVVFAFGAHAQVTVVKVTDSSVYLDTSTLGKPVQKGDSFKIIVSSETLTNPKTGKDLGLIYTYSPYGKITEVQPLYAVGTLPEKTEVSVGQEAVIEAVVAPSFITPAQTASPREAAFSKRILKRYDPVDQQIVSITEGNVSTEKAHDIITLSDKGQVTVWQRGTDNKLTELFSYQLPMGKKGITVSAKDIKNTGTDQIFVSAYDDSRQTISTFVLAKQNNALELLNTMNYFVKEIGCGENKKLFAQSPFLTGTRPGSAREVVFRKNRFTGNSTHSFSTQNNWLTGINYYPVQMPEKDNLIYTSSNGQIRIVLNNGKRAESKNTFASTPNRISYNQEIVRFYPSVQAFGENDNAVIAAVENTTKMGLLSDTFGQYQRGNIHFLAYEQGRLTDKEVIELDGVLYDTACTDNEILTAEVLPDGTSTVVTISKN